MTVSADWIESGLSDNGIRDLGLAGLKKVTKIYAPPLKRQSYKLDRVRKMYPYGAPYVVHSS